MNQHLEEYKKSFSSEEVAEHSIEAIVSLVKGQSLQMLKEALEEFKSLHPTRVRAIALMEEVIRRIEEFGK